MKTIKEIIHQDPVYLHRWKEKIDVIGDFEDIYMTGEEYRNGNGNGNIVGPWWQENKLRMDQAITDYKDINILFASYGQDNYFGDAWVLYEKDGKLYEVNGSHCSCYGLENQWNPEEVMLKELENRLVNGMFGEDDWSGNEFKAELKEFLGIK